MTRLSSSAFLAGIAALALTATASAQPLTTRPTTGPSATPPASAAPANPATPDPSAAAPSTSAAPSAGAAASTSFTDAQVSNFAAASTEIQPLTANLTTATPDQRTQATTQIRAALARHNIDSATYNAIASAAQSDTALAARINAARAPG